jgi:hypothetical protein
MKELKETPLWTAFAGKADDGQRAMVTKLAGDAADKLSQVVQTFPTYTLHDRVHSLNVVRLMGDLLGSRVGDISALEGAMLILSAFYHDIGMVFTPEERAAIGQDPWFQRFLRDHPDAFLAVEQAEGKEVPLEVAEWYCRWRHADRAAVYLDRLPAESLAWGPVSLKGWLATLCRSHNQDHIALRDDAVFRPDVHVQAERCDLRMCAVLLRLADILDFDQTRSPQSVYEHLGLEHRKGPRKAASDDEWRKHSASLGFTFPTDPAERETPFLLRYSAAPMRPEVEHSLRQFLGVVHRELNDSARVLAASSKQWRDLVLPDRIDDNNIHSQNYKYGMYRFDLDRHQVLELFMGDNLYESPYAFVRELIQNAIDTSRHRRFFEHSRGDGNFEPDPIQVSEWRDTEHRQWIRFDDFGMGMSEELILDYFLRVGQSYYSSSRFKADVLRYHKVEGREFVPISRFGIGVLSCFVICDRVEISTRHGDPGDDTSPAIRLSLSGLESFYTLQVEGRHQASPMPSSEGDQQGYRARRGTSIAVRVDPRRESGQLDLREVIGRHLLAPPVPLELDGERLGGDPVVLADQPWATPSTTPIDPHVQRSIEGVLGAALSEPMTLHVLPLDLTAASPDSNLRGQVVVVTLRGGDDLRRALAPDPALKAIGLPDVKGLALGMATSEHGWLVDGRPMFHISSRRHPLGDRGSIGGSLNLLRAKLQEASGSPAAETLARVLKQMDERSSDLGPVSGPTFWTSVTVPNFATQAGLDVLDLGIRSSLALSHNGIRLPVQARHYLPVSSSSIQTPEGSFGTILGFLHLSDRLRPDVSVSRDMVRGIPWSVHSAVHLAVLNALDRAGEDVAAWKPFPLLAVGPTTSGRVIELGMILDDPQLLREDGWASVPVIPTGAGRLSLRQIQVARGSGATVDLLSDPWRSDFLGGPQSRFDFLRLCAAALLQVGVQLAWVEDDATGDWICTVQDPAPAAMEKGLWLFPPSFFIPYKDSTLLKRGRRALNLEHPFSCWLVAVAPELREEYPELLTVLRETLLTDLERADSRDTVTRTVNAILDRIRLLKPSMAPAREAYVKPEDLVVEPRKDDP